MYENRTVHQIDEVMIVMLAFAGMECLSHQQCI